MQAWTTLLTRPGYLPGVLALGRSLQQAGSRFPLRVMVTAGIDDDVRATLQAAGHQVREVEPVGPADTSLAGYANARFAEVWTKLAVWDQTDLSRTVFLDADMLVLQNMDELFTLELPPGGIAACHACRCNPNKIASYPPDWRPETCFYTHARTAAQVSEPGIVPYLNGGLLVLEPDRAVYDDQLATLGRLGDVSGYPFAEQDFLNEYYAGRWQPLPYVYNALKTLGHQHPQLWDLAEVKNLHYIIDKPWDVPLDPSDRYVELYRIWRAVADGAPVPS